MLYRIFTANSKAKKRLKEYLNVRNDIKNKLERLKTNPRSEVGAHPLHGRLAGKFGCWLGSNIRMVYSIDESRKLIIIESVGTHKIY